MKDCARNGNHVLLTGQRRMGKTSITRELGRQLEADGWAAVFTDVEDANCAEDAIVETESAARPIRSLLGLISDMLPAGADIGVGDFHLKLRSKLNSGNWCRHGGNLIRNCANGEQRILLVVDELPIFLKRLQRDDGYPECNPNGCRFPSRLLKNWWAARFRHHHVSLAEGQAAQ